MNWLLESINGLANFIIGLFAKEKDADIPQSRSNKRYSEMNRQEKRQYKRFLAKHNMWDAEIVIENLQKQNQLNVRD